MRAKLPAKLTDEQKKKIWKTALEKAEAAEEDFGKLPARTEDCVSLTSLWSILLDPHSAHELAERYRKHLTTNCFRCARNREIALRKLLHGTAYDFNATSYMSRGDQNVAPAARKRAQWVTGHAKQCHGCSIILNVLTGDQRKLFPAFENPKPRNLEKYGSDTLLIYDPLFAFDKKVVAEGWLGRETVHCLIADETERFLLKLTTKEDPPNIMFQHFPPKNPDKTSLPTRVVWSQNGNIWTAQKGLPFFRALDGTPEQFILLWIVQ